MHQHPLYRIANQAFIHNRKHHDLLYREAQQLETVSDDEIPLQSPQCVVGTKAYDELKLGLRQLSFQLGLVSVDQ